MNVLIVYFSWTSTVERVAEAIGDELSGRARIKLVAIQPQKPHGYWGWLARSMIPHWRVAIECPVLQLAPYDLVCLGFPKWTFACPPVNQFITSMRGSAGKRFALFMCHRGFDEERYFQSMVQKLLRRRVQIVATLKLKRDAVRSQGFHQRVHSFCGQIDRALAVMNAES